MSIDEDLDSLVVRRSILSQEFWFPVCPSTGEVLTSDFDTTIGFRSKESAKDALREYLEIVAKVKFAQLVDMN